MADLELKYSEQSRFYLAPLQIKANGGILVIDDFGRQLVQEASFLEILSGVCEKNGIAFAPENGRYLIDRYYWPKGRNFRGVHPRDIIDLLLDISSFQRRTPEFTPEWIDLACASYFIEDNQEI